MMCVLFKMKSARCALTSRQLASRDALRARTVDEEVDEELVVVATAEMAKMAVPHALVLCLLLVSKENAGPVAVSTTRAGILCAQI